MRVSHGATKGLGSAERAEKGSNSRLEDTVALWPTAQSRDHKGVDRTSIDRGNARPLNEVAAMWPTPDAIVANDREEPESFLARQEREKLKGHNGNGMGVPLAMASKLWSTPTGSTGGAEINRDATTGDKLRSQAELWRTPTGCDAERGAAPEWALDPRAGEHSLRQQTSLWRSPLVSEARGSSGVDGVELADQAIKWMTPQATDSNAPSTNRLKTDRPTRTPENHGSMRVDLKDQAALWDTPTVGDVTGGHTSRSGGRQGEPLLNEQARIVAENWMTPRTGQGGYTRDNGDPTKERPTLEGQATHFRPALAMRKDGEILPADPRVSSRRSLNPLFVEWLMGWAPGWVFLASISSDNSAMAWFLWWRDTRSALWLLPLPAAPEPPAQLDLFA